MAANTERVVIITGAAGGLGRVVAQRFAQAGYQLALVGSQAGRLTELAGELAIPVERLLTFAGDLTQPDTAGKLRQVVLDKFKRVDILLHFVGGWIGGKGFEQVTADDLATMLSQHVWTTYYLTKAFIPDMRNQGWGRLIVISSPVVGTPPAKNLPYTLGKSGQEALILTLAEELKSSGVTANIIRVRTIDTQHERDSSPSPKNSFWTTPEEIVSAIEYLCSDDGAVVNGARLPLYGSP
jgi:NAD(P)-dependent dehydrogenase (short-subunit alcohol dehydrogenase family)